MGVSPTVDRFALAYFAVEKYLIKLLTVSGCLSTVDPFVLANIILE